MLRQIGHPSSRPHFNKKEEIYFKLLLFNGAIHVFFGGGGHLKLLITNFQNLTKTLPVYIHMI